MKIEKPLLRESRLKTVRRKFISCDAVMLRHIRRMIRLPRHSSAMRVRVRALQSKSSV